MELKTEIVNELKTGKASIRRSLYDDLVLVKLIYEELGVLSNSRFFPQLSELRVGEPEFHQLIYIGERRAPNLFIAKLRELEPGDTPSNFYTVNDLVRISKYDGLCELEDRKFKNPFISNQMRKVSSRPKICLDLSNQAVYSIDWTGPFTLKTISQIYLRSLDSTVIDKDCTTKEFNERFEIFDNVFQIETYFNLIEKEKQDSSWTNCNPTNTKDFIKITENVGTKVIIIDDLKNEMTSSNMFKKDRTCDNNCSVVCGECQIVEKKPSMYDIAEKIESSLEEETKISFNKGEFVADPLFPFWEDKEIKRQGFIEGVKFKTLNTGEIRTFLGVNSINRKQNLIWSNTPQEEWLKKENQSNPLIYEDGQWAEVVNKDIILSNLSKLIMCSPQLPTIKRDLEIEKEFRELYEEWYMNSSKSNSIGKLEDSQSTLIDKVKEDSKELKSTLDDKVTLEKNESFNYPWRKDLGYDTIREDTIQVYILDSKGDVVCSVVGKDIEEVDEKAKQIISLSKLRPLLSKLVKWKSTTSSLDVYTIINEIETML